MQILEEKLLAEEIDGVNEIMMSLRSGKLEDTPLPPIEEIMNIASRVNVTKEDLQILKKEYDTNIAKNPPREIKRLPTLFNIGNDEESKNDNIGDSSPDFPMTNPSPNVLQFTPIQVSHQLRYFYFKF